MPLLLIYWQIKSQQTRNKFLMTRHVRAFKTYQIIRTNKLNPDRVRDIITLFRRLNIKVGHVCVLVI